MPAIAALGWHSWTGVYAGILLGLGTIALTAITLRRLGHLAPGTQLPLGPFLIAAAVTVASGRSRCAAIEPRGKESGREL